MAFFVRATYLDRSHEIVFHTAGRFPLYSDIQKELQERFEIPHEQRSDFRQSVWNKVLFYPDHRQNARIMFKKNICDAAEFENAQRPFMLKRYPSPCISFTVLDSSDDSLINLNKKREGRRLVKATSDLTIECESLEKSLHRERNGLSRYERKLQEANTTGREYDIPIWSAQIALVQKGIEKLEQRFNACVNERNTVVNQLMAPTLGYASFREFLDAEDYAEARLYQDTLDELDAWGVGDRPRHPGASASAFPPLESVMSDRRQRGPSYHNRPYWAPYGRNTRQPPSNVARQPGIACALEAIASDFIPEHFRRDLDSLQPARDMMHNALDGPYQRLWNGAQQIGTTLRELRDLPVPQVHWMDRHRRSLPPTMNPDDIPRMDRGVPCLRTMPFMDEWPACDSGPSYTEMPAETSTAAAAKHFSHRNFSCDGCQQSIKGLRFQCKHCDNYDLCHDCLMNSVHSGLHPVDHDFRLIPHRDLKRALDFEEISSTRVEKKEHPASCDICTKRITGVRIKCIDCPDWDCCEGCTETTNRIHQGHTFVKLNEASDLIEPPYRVASKVRHANILCDMCDKTICGDRWKCVHPDCADYDLCDNCQAHPDNTHPRRHPILRLAEPINVDFVSQIQESMPRSAKSLGKQREVVEQSPAKRVKLELPVINDVGTQSDAMEVEAGPSAPLAGTIRETPAGLIQCYSYDHLAICPPKPEEQNGTTSTTRTPSPPTIEVITPTDGPSPSDIFSGVRDVTIPDGSRLPVGAEFTKTWAMEHFASGTDYKFESLRLVHESGGLLGKGCKATVAFGANDIQSGSKVEVSLDGLKVPNLPEQQIIEQWRFRDVNGSPYGEPLRIRFTVESGMNDSLSHSSFIMPKVDHQQEARQVREESPAPESPASLAWTIDVPSPRVLHPESSANEAQPESDFDLVERSNSRQSQTPSSSVTDDQLDLDLDDSEFDFVDESEDEAASN